VALPCVLAFLTLAAACSSPSEERVRKYRKSSKIVARRAVIAGELPERTYSIMSMFWVRDRVAIQPSRDCLHGPILVDLKKGHWEPCHEFDRDSDGDVDLRDFAVWDSLGCCEG